MEQKQIVSEVDQLPIRTRFQSPLQVSRIFRYDNLVSYLRGPSGILGFECLVANIAGEYPRQHKHLTFSFPEIPPGAKVTQSIHDFGRLELRSQAVKHSHRFGQGFRQRSPISDTTSEKHRSTSYDQRDRFLVAQLPKRTYATIPLLFRCFRRACASPGPDVLTGR